MATRTIYIETPLLCFYTAATHCLLSTHSHFTNDLDYPVHIHYCHSSKKHYYLMDIIFYHIFLQVIFRYALALFKYTEEDILKIHHSVDIYQYLRFITRTITDSR